MIDHIGLTVTNHKKSKNFYANALAPLNIALVAEANGWSGFGKLSEAKADFWFGEDDHPQAPIPIAFMADSRAQVDLFYHAAISAGGKDNSKPGLRDEYHAHYYGAFVIDTDGHNIEAVRHAKHYISS